MKRGPGETLSGFISKEDLTEYSERNTEEATDRPY